MRHYAAFLNLIASFLLIGGGLSAQDNILDATGGRKVKISILERYNDRLLTFHEEGDLFREVYPAPQPLAARIEAPSLAIDLLAINGSTEFSINMGEFSFSATLGDDPRYISGKKSATFPLGSFVERPDGSERFKKVGSITVAWTASKLRVIIACSDLELAQIGTVGAPSYVEFADPGKTLKGGGEPVTVTLAFGALAGEAQCNASVITSTALRTIGNPNSEFYDEFLLSRVTLKAGTAVVAQELISPGGGGGGSDPRVTGTASPLPGMLVNLSGTIRGLLDVTVSSITVMGMPVTADVTIGAPDPKGVTQWSIIGVPAMFPKKNFIAVTFAGTDSTGQATTVVFQITTLVLP